MTPALAIHNVSRAYGALLAVDDVSFQVGAGQVVGLVGPNGAGKTTVMRCMVGLLRPGSGTVMVDGHDLAADPGAAKRACGFVPETPDLFEYLTVADHLEFMARLYDVADPETAIAAARDPLGLSDIADKLPEQLSAGMRQRLALGCALVATPKLLVLDEPLTNVDPIGARTIKDELRRRAEAGMGVLLSSHMLPLVEELADRVVVMAGGRVRFDGTMGEVRSTIADRAGALEDFFLSVTRDAPNLDTPAAE
ncbi:MAG: ABC transporter ATP-binding protein [Planctomycetota bacterium]|jgi:ABC-2 type transport system ATP-binding protein